MEIIIDCHEQVDRLMLTIETSKRERERKVMTSYIFPTMQRRLFNMTNFEFKKFKTQLKTKIPVPYDLEENNRLALLQVEE